MVVVWRRENACATMAISGMKSLRNVCPSARMPAIMATVWRPTSVAVIPVMSSAWECRGFAIRSARAAAPMAIARVPRCAPARWAMPTRITPLPQAVSLCAIHPARMALASHPATAPAPKVTYLPRDRVTSVFPAAVPVARMDIVVLLAAVSATRDSRRHRRTAVRPHADRAVARTPAAPLQTPVPAMSATSLSTAAPPNASPSVPGTAGMESAVVQVSAHAWKVFRWVIKLYS